MLIWKENAASSGLFCLERWKRKESFWTMYAFCQILKACTLHLSLCQKPSEDFCASKEREMEEKMVLRPSQCVNIIKKGANRKNKVDWNIDFSLKESWGKENEMEIGHQGSILFYWKRCSRNVTWNMRCSKRQGLEEFTVKLLILMWKAEKWKIKMFT